MMRVMKKILKRKISIVMAVLVILGIAVYGGSAFADEAQEQAASAGVEISDEYIYLNPLGMNSNQNADWNSESASVCIRFTAATNGGDPKSGTYDNGIWKFRVSDFQSYGSSKFYFTYIDGADAGAWTQINGNDYYRTGESTLTVDEARGSVVVQNGTTFIDNNAYAIAVKKSYADNTISFVDMTGKLTGVKVQLGVDDTYSDGRVLDAELTNSTITITIPPNGINPYQYMRYVKANGDAITDSYKIGDSINKGGTLYYGIRQASNGEISSDWSGSKTNTESPSFTNGKLYFDNLHFNVNNAEKYKCRIVGIDNSEKELTADSKDSKVLSYVLSGGTITNNTIFELIDGTGNVYRFYPNGSDNLVTFEGENVCVKGTYTKTTTHPIYLDTTLSKLQYATADCENNSLPRDGENIFFFAWNNEYVSQRDNTNGANFATGKLTKISEYKKNGNTWSDVYKAELKEEYPHILFYSAKSDTAVAPWAGVPDDASKTVDLDLTDVWKNYTNPCFYADTSDDAIYNSKTRSGYWDNIFSIRDADGKTKAKANEPSVIVDVPDGTLDRDSNTLYVNTTLYDYYSDYELNGNNRDNYSDKDLNESVSNLHFIYQPFRQFDQALSSYYSKNSASSPIYWGNFQNYIGSPYSDIKNTLDLYGSNDWSKFIYDNNSMWGRNSGECNGSSNPAGVLGDGHNATQGLVSDTLSQGKLMIKTSSGTVAAPYFDESFLTGTNSKNTVLGKVYKNVTFPFVKKSMQSKSDESNKGNVEYWCYDSADSSNSNHNLQLQKSTQDGYFLTPTESHVKGQTADAKFPATAADNYFPFNNSRQSGKAVKLNYGFGQKFDLKFKLTDGGTVTASNGSEVPIEFNFSGDDDVWVFIDGKLVLDVGGGHGVVTGTINFRDKKATVSSVKNNTSSGGITKNVVKGFEDVITDDNITKEHTLTMFYMERGLWESNLSLSFNFPDENEFQVEKNVDTDGVANDFKSCFNNVSAFPFTILNQATHYDTHEATGGQNIGNKPFNATFADNTIDHVGANTFAHLDTCKDAEGKGTARSDVVHWMAELNDETGQYKDLRWGIIYPSSGKEKEFDATYKIGEGTPNHYKYLQFSLYDGVVTETPSLNNMYVELEDSRNNKIGGFLSAGNTYNSLNLKKGKWNTITIDLDKLSKNEASFDFSKIKNIKFDYNLSRDMYLDDFIFVPSSEVTQPTGFVTKQYEIPDYGSAKSGTLMYPVNAVYTVSSESTSTTNLLGKDGTFTLANGETATFADQFRRGSYIALSEDVDTDVFEPSWTLYENGQEVKTNSVPANTNTVKQVDPVTLPTQNGQNLRDGRQEKYASGPDSDGQEQSNDGYTKTDWAKKYGTKSSDTDRDEKNTIVFRSFTDPDSSTTATKLKVKYTNKVRTGAIRIAKTGAYESDTDENLNGEYQIKVTFTNIAGMALENGKKYEYTYKLRLGQYQDITGIPAGTEYTISEILPSDDSSLDDIAITQPTYSGDDSKYTATKEKDSSGNWVIKGIIKADSKAESTVFTFKNTKKPVINLTVVKNWTGGKNNTTLPDSVTVKLQRRVKDAPENEWADVHVTDSKGNKTTVITLEPDYQNTANSWKYVFRNLDRYPDYTASQDNPYEYRVVEVVKEGETYKELKTGDYFNDCFKVQSYNGGNNVSVDESETSTKVDKTYTITNVYSPKTNIKITKVDASNEKLKLSDVEFTLEKLKPDANGDNYVVDDTFASRKETTSDQGIAEFADLPDGRYRLTETKAKEGYSLLKDPITIVINRTGTTVVDNETYEFGETDDTKNTISLQISNRMKFLLPKTGGYGAMLFILCGMALATLGCLIFFLITLRKEVQYSRLKRQRRNAIGK
ncbi:SpaA isopeptide-forming pilin-related protein [Agathobacter sp.]|uniref:SpaA isopeptide-forming pilin-related protein n=1 Tax=Agathobacter sp. TaxID=2021311 RepID=UPI003FD6F35B